MPELNRRIEVLSRTLLSKLLRLEAESNRCIAVLQTAALPLRHRAIASLANAGSRTSTSDFIKSERWCWDRLPRYHFANAPRQTRLARLTCRHITYVNLMPKHQSFILSYRTNNPKRQTKKRLINDIFAPITTDCGSYENLTV